MADINREQFRIALPKGGLNNSAQGLLVLAEFPTRPFQKVVQFDSNACALKAPADEARVAFSVRIRRSSPEGILRDLEAGKLDFGIVPLDRLPEPKLKGSQPIQRVDLWDQDLRVVVPSELVANTTFEREVMEAESLRGIEGFRNRLAVRLIRACNGVTEESLKQAGRKLREDQWNNDRRLFEGSDAFWRRYN